MMCRALIAGSLGICLGALLAAAGCRPAEPKVPSNVPPSTPAAEKKAADNEKTSEAAAPAIAQGESPEGLKELSAEDRAAAEKQLRLPRQRRSARRNGQTVQDHRPRSDGVSMLSGLRRGLPQESGQVLRQDEVMAANDIPTPAAEAASAPPEAPLSRRQKFRLVGLVVLKRLRFIAILAAVGLFIGYWDTVMNYWDKWTQPRQVAVRQLDRQHEFFCPMDPQVVRSNYEPNGEVPKCPICGMPLSIRKKGEATKLPEGVTGRVQLSPERIQLAGIKTVPVEYRPMAKETKTVGYVAFDESRLSKIVSRVDGYVEKLYVDKTFDVVKKGDPLAEVYSPELYSTAGNCCWPRGAAARPTWRLPPAPNSCSWESVRRTSRPS